MVWLAAHALLLGVILSLKFLGAKTLLLLAMAGTAIWFVARQMRVSRAA